MDLIHKDMIKCCEMKDMETMSNAVPRKAWIKCKTTYCSNSMDAEVYNTHIV